MCRTKYAFAGTVLPCDEILNHAEQSLPLTLLRLLCRELLWPTSGIVNE